ncbi:helix-turn-helix domain-containing protein [Pedobacter mucosus]|uniref:helix-turn-helix domain-containing protein n=1 Tax=Pedobacter mucosus TaxID=2895286 RepID=UPI001EE4BBB6|nr:helix-turn-helix domain-containing protein [Pedobacter mucosus]UKT65452.1 helix-turn-helix domain-containing protein [Pedobacter mucosus]
MDKVNLLTTVAVVTISISLFLSLFLLTVKTAHQLSNRLFTVFLILHAIDNSVNLDYLFEIPLTGRIFISSFFFLQLPVFYLYVLSVCYSDFKLKPVHLTHIIPFLLANFVLLPRFYTVDLASKISFLAKGSSMVEVQFNHILMHVQCVFYIVAAFMILRKAKKIYLENYTGASLESLNWLFQFTVALSIFFAIAFLKNIFKFTAYPNISNGLKVGLILSELIIIFWYLYKALNNPSLFRNIDSKLKLVSEIILEEKNSNPEVINENEHSLAILTLKQYMVAEKPFLNPSLTIQEVAKDIKIPVRELSVLINHNLDQHFYDFINHYRIAYAMDILKDASKNKLTVLEILYAAGFNSKSSFNTAFKKHTGHTPTEYRKALQDKVL